MEEEPSLQYALNTGNDQEIVGNLKMKKKERKKGRHYMAFLVITYYVHSSVNIKTPLQVAAAAAASATAVAGIGEKDSAQLHSVVKVIKGNIS